jgi:hypothetical protein
MTAPFNLHQDLLQSTVCGAEELCDGLRDDGQTITHYVVTPYLQVSCGYTYTVFSPMRECVGLS